MSSAAKDLPVPAECSRWYAPWPIVSPSYQTREAASFVVLCFVRMAAARLRRRRRRCQHRRRLRKRSRRRRRLRFHRGCHRHRPMRPLGRFPCRRGLLIRAPTRATTRAVTIARGCSRTSIRPQLWSNSSNPCMGTPACPPRVSGRLRMRCIRCRPGRAARVTSDAWRGRAARWRLRRRRIRRWPNMVPRRCVSSDDLL